VGVTRLSSHLRPGGDRQSTGGKGRKVTAANGAVVDRVFGFHRNASSYAK
jgi:hypothetical protein